MVPGCLRRLTFSFRRVRKNSQSPSRALSLLIQCLVKQAKNLTYWCWFVKSKFTKLHRKCFLYETNGRASMFNGVLPTLSPGSSRFPKWCQQERRPWHTAEITWLICPWRVEIYSKWRPRLRGRGSGYEFDLLRELQFGGIPFFCSRPNLTNLCRNACYAGYESFDGFHMIICGFLSHPKAKITKFSDQQASKISVRTKYFFVRCTQATNLKPWAP